LANFGGVLGGVHRLISRHYMFIFTVISTPSNTLYISLYILLNKRDINRDVGKDASRDTIYIYYSLLNVRFGSLLGPHGLLLIYMWGENSFKKTL